MDGSCGGGSSCPAAAREQISYFFGEQIQLPFSSSSSPPECRERGGGFPGVDQLECDFEEDGGKPAAPSRGGSGSKRSRAAEVHNLSEKRRRSRINEKMRALQNLIPNSNKTDKASMLDEAIEYLKQLQLQVQMLSMRNGLNLHDMYLSTMVQSPLQASEICMGFNGENRIAMNTGQGMFSHNHQSLSHQIQNIVTSIAAPQESFQIPMTAEILPDDIVLQQQLEVRRTTGGTKGLTPHFVGECSLLEGHGELQRGISSVRQFNVCHLDDFTQKMSHFDLQSSNLQSYFDLQSSSQKSAFTSSTELWKRSTCSLLIFGSAQPQELQDLSLAFYPRLKKYELVDLELVLDKVVVRIEVLMEQYMVH